jgi:hypothetical protein
MIDDDFNNFIKECIKPNFYKIWGDNKHFYENNTICGRKISFVDSWKDLLNIQELNFKKEILFTMFELEGHDYSIDFFGIDKRYNDWSKINTPEDVHETYKNDYFVDYFDKSYVGKNFEKIHFFLKTMGVLIGTNGMRKIFTKTVDQFYKNIGLIDKISDNDYSNLLFLDFILTKDIENVILDLLIKETIIYLNDKQPKLIHGYINRINKITDYIGEFYE